MDLNAFSHFGDFVKALRQSQALSQRAMAKALEVSPGYVGQWEAGVSKPSEAVVRRICLIFNLPDETALQRLAYAETAPDHIKEVVLSDCRKRARKELVLTEAEVLLIKRLHSLPLDLRCAVTRKFNAILAHQLDEQSKENTF